MGESFERLGMTRRRFAWIALAALGALVIAGLAWGAFGPTTIVLTAPQIQQRINRALPREFKGVTVERATVAIADQKVALRVEARASALGQTLSTAVSARGVPRYDPAQGEIFFDPEDVKIEDVGLAGGALVERLSARLGERASMFRNTAAAGVTAFLAARPVYRFKDDLKGIVGKAALGDISMKPDAIVITVSVARLTTTIAIGLAALLIVIVLVVQLIRHPRWGTNRGGAQQTPASS
jgi:uncharacterized protein DUF1439